MTPAWWQIAAVVAVVPAAGVATGALASRHLVASPLGVTRRARPPAPRPWGLLLVGTGLGAMAVAVSGAFGRLQAVMMAGILLVVRGPRPGPMGRVPLRSARWATYLRSGGAPILVLLVTASTLAVHAAESLVDRRRVLAALVAAGTPVSVLRDALRREAMLTPVPLSVGGVLIGAVVAGAVGVAAADSAGTPAVNLAGLLFVCGQVAVTIGLTWAAIRIAIRPCPPTTAGRRTGEPAHRIAVMTSQRVLAASRKRSPAETRLLVAVRRAERLQRTPEDVPSPPGRDALVTDIRDATPVCRSSGGALSVATSGQLHLHA